MTPVGECNNGLDIRVVGDKPSPSWNIYHLACLSPHNKRVKLVEHLLMTLPLELTRELMAQRSREALNTVRPLFTFDIAPLSWRPQPLMLAVKRGNVETARILLRFGVDPAVLLLRDADGCTPLHDAVQKADTVLAKLLLRYGPTQHLHTENCVGQTPLDIASLKSLPRVTDLRLLKPVELQMNVEQHLRSPQNPPPFDLRKQKREIPKLRATLDALLADGTIAHGSKLTTELLAFADRMEQRLTEETVWQNAAEKQPDEDEMAPSAPGGTPAQVYSVLLDGAVERPGTRQLVQLADIRRSVQRNLAQQSKWTFAQRFQLPRAADVEDKKTDTEEEHVTELLAAQRRRSMFSPAYESNFCLKHVDLFGEDRF